MSWHISKALMNSFENSRSLPEQVAAFSAATCSDGVQSAPSSGSPTPQLYLPSDRMTAFSRLSRFGMTFGLLTDDLGGELLTWFRAGFPARTSAPPAGVPDSTENAPGSGERWPASLAKYDRDSRSWKTAQFSLLGDLELFSETWPRWGMTHGGEFYPQPTPERPTSENESGSLLPTPTTVDSGSYFNRSASPGAIMRPTLGAMAKHNLWASPASADAMVSHGGGQGRSLRTDIHNWKHGLWPTPTVDGNYNRKGASAKSGDGLATAVAGGRTTPPTYPTPTASTGGPEPEGETGRKLTTVVGGQLNPEWVEWLMNWPIGWTDLAPLPKENFDDWECRTQTGAENVQDREMRVLWWDNDPAETPYRPRSPEQQSREYQDPLPAMSQERTSEGGRLGRGIGQEVQMPDMRDSIPAEEIKAVNAMLESELSQGVGKIVGRVAMGVKARVDRLKAIGNGQVPATHNLAWRTLR